MASLICGGVYYLWKADQILSSCQNFPTSQSCQNIPTGQSCQYFPTGQSCHNFPTVSLASTFQLVSLARTFQLVSLARTFQLVSQQKLSNWSASIDNKNPNILSKWPPVAITVPLRLPAPSLGHWYTGVYLRIFDPGPSNPTTFLGLFSPGDYRQSIESPMSFPTFNSTEKALTFTIYDCILRIRPKKVCYLTKVSPLDVVLI